MSVVALDPLDLVDWIHGSSGPTDDLDRIGRSGVFGVSDTVDFNSAPMLEQMINEVQGRLAAIGMPAYSFSFGIGTEDATGLVAGLADGGDETFSGGFVERPLLDHFYLGASADKHTMTYLGRALLAEGYVPEDEDETEAVFEVMIVVADTGPNFLGFIWRKGQSGDWTWPPDQSNMKWEHELSDGVTIRWPENLWPVPWMDYLPVANDDYLHWDLWTFRCVKTARRTDELVAWVLVNEMILAIEECARGTGVKDYDFGDAFGLHPTFHYWLNENGMPYTGKALVYDCDTRRQVGFLTNEIRRNPLKENMYMGMLGAIMQVRGIVDALRYPGADDSAFRGTFVGEAVLYPEEEFMDFTEWAPTRTTGDEQHWWETPTYDPTVLYRDRADNTHQRAYVGFFANDYPAGNHGDLGWVEHASRFNAVRQLTTWHVLTAKKGAARIRLKVQYHVMIHSNGMSIPAIPFAAGIARMKVWQFAAEVEAPRFYATPPESAPAYDSGDLVFEEPVGSPMYPSYTGPVEYTPVMDLTGVPIYTVMKQSLFTVVNPSHVVWNDRGGMHETSVWYAASLFVEVLDADTGELITRL